MNQLDNINMDVLLVLDAVVDLNILESFEQLIVTSSFPSI